MQTQIEGRNPSDRWGHRLPILLTGVIPPWEGMKVEIRSVGIEDRTLIDPIQPIVQGERRGNFPGVLSEHRPAIQVVIALQIAIR